MQHGSNHHILCMLDIVPHLSFMILHIFNPQHLAVIFKEKIIWSVRSRLHCVPMISWKTTGSPLKKSPNLGDKIMWDLSPPAWIWYLGFLRLEMNVVLRGEFCDSAASFLAFWQQTAKGWMWILLCYCVVSVWVLEDKQWGKQLGKQGLIAMYH